MPQNKPFQLFSPEEIDQINLSQLDPDLSANIKLLISIFNEGMHNVSVGWCTRLSKALQQTHEEPALLNTEEIKEGIARYLEGAHRLQRPRQGEIRQVTLASGRTIKSEVNVYEAFWNDCYEVFIYAFLKEAAQSSPELVTPDINKSLIYALISFKNYTVPSLGLKDEAKITQIQNYINKVIQKIHSHLGLDQQFLVTEKIVASAHVIRDELITRYKKLLDLKAAFEAEPHYANYVHIRPQILRQLAQALDYNYSMIEEQLEERKKKILIFKKKNNREHLKKCLSILQEKRKEIASVTFFQEKLCNSFGSDDFIEVLHRLVKNSNAKLLPTAPFFQFDKQKEVKVTQYAADNLDVPQPPPEELNTWRSNYINRFAEPAILAVLAATPISQLQIAYHQLLEWENKLSGLREQEKLQKEYTIIPVKLMSLVKANNILSFQIPDELLVFFLEEEPLNPASDFFIHQSAGRDFLFQINKYGKSITFLLQQTTSALELCDLFIFKEGNFFLSTSNMGIKHHFLVLTEASTYFKTAYQMELTLVEKAKEKCENRQIFACYKEAIQQAYSQFELNVLKILYYWVLRIANQEEYTYIGSALHSFNKLIYNAVIASDNQALLKNFPKKLLAQLQNDLEGNRNTFFSLNSVPAANRPLARSEASKWHEPRHRARAYAPVDEDECKHPEYRL